MKRFNVIFALLYSSLSLAGDMGVAPANLWQPVIMLGGGPAWSNPGKTQTVLLLPAFSQRYVALSNTATIANGELFLGVQHTVMPSVLGQFGLTVATTTSIPLKGDIWQDNDPEFNNFNYSYNLRHTHVAVGGKLFTDCFQRVQPYVSASVGVGFNQAYAYSDRPKLIEVAPEAPFRSQTQTALTYTLGAGVQKPLNDHWSIGVGYEFTDWGKSQLGAAALQTSGEGLRLNQAYVNQLLFSLSFVA